MPDDTSPEGSKNILGESSPKSRSGPSRSSRSADHLGRLNRVQYYLLVALVLLSPLPLASNRPLAWSLLCAGIGIFLLWDAFVGFLGARPKVNSVQTSRAGRSLFLKRMVWPLVLWIGVAWWALFQTVPLDGEIVGWAHPLWASAETVLGQTLPKTISLDPDATRTAEMRFLAYGGIFWIAARYCSDQRLAALTIRGFCIATLLYGVFGIIMFFSGTDIFLWYDNSNASYGVKSTFVNRNNFATFAGLGLVAWIGTAHGLLVGQQRNGETVRQMLRGLVAEKLGAAMMALFAIILLFTALLLTNSRGGFISFAVGVTTLLMAFAYIRKNQSKHGSVVTSRARVWLRGWGIGIIGAGLVLSMVNSSQILLGRLAGIPEAGQVRSQLFSRTLEATGGSPLFGHGYGTFEQAFQIYKTPDLSIVNWGKAHNSYLELAFELGWPATLAVVGVFLLIGKVFLNGLRRRRRRQHYAAIGLALTTLVATHALFDFSLQIPAVAACYALLAGACWAQSWPSTPRRRAP